MSTVLSREDNDAAKQNGESLSEVVSRVRAEEKEFQGRSTPERGLVRGEEILLPLDGLDDEKDSRARELVQYAIKIAKEFRMKLVLVYSIPHVELPDEYVQYAKIEGVMDYYSSYLESISSEAISKWSKILRAEGVEFEKMTYIGSTDQAIIDATESRNVGLVVRRIKSKGRRGPLSNLFGIRDHGLDISARTRVPILAIP